jgi:hypothetical protein
MRSPKSSGTLLFHDGELDDVCALLEDLGTRFSARLGELEAEDQQSPWDLIIGTPQRLLALPPQMLGSSRQRIAICGQDSRTLRNSLSRAGIDLIIRRPVHPAALRALLLHALYRGPEKRRLPRASIGAPVRYRAGWRQYPAILADLSLGGCRLLTPHPGQRGKTITLLLPADLTRGRGVALKARVLRVALAADQPEGTKTLIAKFERPGARADEALKRILAAHASGPAKIDPATAAQVASTTPDVGQQPQPVSETTIPAKAEPSSARRNRREHPRRSINPLVVQLRDEADRVLVGRDISLGGMRVDPNRGLSVGQVLRIAIHANGLDVPLIVTAQVLRDDGRDGLALRFVDLPGEASEGLARALEKLPILAPTDVEGAMGRVVSEILRVEDD